ncbi:hypothetical protein [Congregibacter litoralis]|uniref:Esterase n=1 Tax=Congregibacter litoralis KT71 TaxID=314285 RepID=A4A7B1_9GAMM|nr:hypothetical protein [Congregibacter litoralis]EAQ98180.2 hypothetical protein KT71_02997 [Congregibacter litoralis KT71]
MKLPLKALTTVVLLGGLWGCNEAPMATAVPAAEQPASGPAFTIRFDEALGTQPQDGRLLLMLSNTDRDEPRFLVDNSLDTQLIYGRNVSDWAPGADMLIDAAHIGFPINSLAELPPGRYFVQALLNRYQDFTLSNGKTVSLPPDQGEGQQWNRKPGNYLSEPVALDITPDGVYEIVLDQQIPPIEPARDTEFVKHVRMKSELLSEFWGEDVYLGAHVLLPHGFEEHPEARYPLMVFHGHFPSDFGAFRPEPPDPDLEPVYSERFSMEGYNIIQQQEAHNNYLRWIADDFPRFLAIEIQHPTPYYDDSYAVNSASQGPYGDAINYELIPFIEEQFRGIGEGWARFTYGGSTGGWEAMATQMFYPDEFNGAFVACPDPIDFRAYLTMNIYEDSNAYYYPSDFQKIPRPGRRDYLGNVTASIKDQNDLERVLGDRNRSGQQFDIWEATFSPMDDDGYPADLWDPETGDIDPEIAAYWKENFDLSYILRRDWETLGPKLEGKLHIYTGDMDNYYLNNAVYLVEEFLESTTAPYYGGEVDYGDRAEHCWNGDQENGNHLSRLRYNWMYVPRILKRIEESAPEGADVSSWRY